MPFFKELRRRSKASFRTSDSSAESNGTVPTTKSTSTLNSSYGASTPPSFVQPNGSTSNVIATKSNGDNTAPPLPPRPPVAPLKSNRNSTVVRDHTPLSRRLSLTAALQGFGSSGSSVTMRSPGATSPFAPKLTSIADNTVVWTDYHRRSVQPC